MSSSNDKGLGNKSIIVIIGLIASCIAICTFLTGWQSIWDVVRSLLSPSAPTSPKQQPTSELVVTVPTNVSTPTFPSVPVNWTSLGLVREPVSDISSSGDVIYVATEGAQHGIFKSEDLGKSWQAINNGLLYYDIRQVEVSPTNPNYVYIASRTIWRSADGGATWFDTDFGHRLEPPTIAIIDGQLLVGGNNEVGFYISHDSGNNWTPFGDSLNILVYKLFVAPSDRMVVYATGWPSMKKIVVGDKWLPLANVGSGLEVLDLGISYHDPSLLFVGTPAGVYKSEDGGGSWIPVNGTLPEQGKDLSCNSIQTSQWENTEVFAVCKGKIYQSKDLGAQWSLIQSPDEVNIIHLMSDSKIMLAATKELGIFSYTLP